MKYLRILSLILVLANYILRIQNAQAEGPDKKEIYDIHLMGSSYALDLDLTKRFAVYNGFYNKIGYVDVLSEDKCVQIGRIEKKELVEMTLNCDRYLPANYDEKSSLNERTAVLLASYAFRDFFAEKKINKIYIGEGKGIYGVIFVDSEGCKFDVGVDSVSELPGHGIYDCKGQREKILKDVRPEHQQDQNQQQDQDQDQDQNQGQQQQQQQTQQQSPAQQQQKPSKPKTEVIDPFDDSQQGQTQQQEQKPQAQQKEEEQQAQDQVQQQIKKSKAIDQKKNSHKIDQKKPKAYEQSGGKGKSESSEELQVLEFAPLKITPNEEE